MDETEDDRKVQQIQNKLKQRKAELLFDMNPVLDALAEEYEARQKPDEKDKKIKIPFEEFVAAFDARTETDFMKRYTRLKRYLTNWELVRVFQDVPHKTMMHNLYENKSNALFIVVESIDKNESRKSSVSPKASKPLIIAQSGFTPAFDSWEMLHGEKIMFTSPCWPGVSDEFRVDNQKMYKEVRDIWEPKKSNIESRYLAKLWWKPRIKKWSQLLYVLSQLKHFKLTELDKTLKEVFPAQWVDNHRNFGINYGMFGISKSKLVELNLIVRIDAENANIFSTNKIIKNCEYEPIKNEIQSLLYDFSENYKDNSVENADRMLLKNMYDWGERNNKSVRMDIIRNVLKKNDQIFEYDENSDRFTAIMYNNIIFVPFFFSPFNC